jgi:hypothetical protein
MLSQKVRGKRTTCHWVVALSTPPCLTLTVLLWLSWSRRKTDLSDYNCGAMWNAGHRWQPNPTAWPRRHRVWICSECWCLHPYADFQPPGLMLGHGPPLRNAINALIKQAWHRYQICWHLVDFPISRTVTIISVV